MIYVNGRGGLDCWAFYSLKDIVNAESGPRLQVVVEIGRPDAGQQCPDPDIPHWDGIRRFPVRHGMSVDTIIGDPAPTSITSMSSADSLEEFVTWGENKFPASRYMLIIWGHGLGLPLTLAQLVDAPPLSPPSRCEAEFGFPGTTKGVFIDDGQGTLYNRDIANVLRKFASQGRDRKLSVIGFDACLMGNVETAYALREAADIMLGSEDAESACSWEYSGPLTNLARAHEPVNAQTLSKWFVKAYDNKYKNDNRTLSAIDLIAMNSLGKSISTLSDELNTNLSRQRKAVTNARAPALRFGPYHNLIDVGDFLQALQKESSVMADRSISNQISSVLSKLRSTVITKVPQSDPNFSGLTIYLPQNLADYTNDAPDREAYDIGKSCPEQERDKKHAVDFVCDTAWSNFVHSYLGVHATKISGPSYGR